MCVDFLEMYTADNEMTHSRWMLAFKQVIWDGKYNDIILQIQ